MSGLRLRLANKLNLKNSPKKYQMSCIREKCCYNQGTLMSSVLQTQSIPQNDQQNKHIESRGEGRRARKQGLSASAPAEWDLPPEEAINQSQGKPLGETSGEA